MKTNTENPKHLISVYNRSTHKVDTFKIDNLTDGQFNELDFLVSMGVQSPLLPEMKSKLLEYARISKSRFLAEFAKGC